MEGVFEESTRKISRILTDWEGKVGFRGDEAGNEDAAGGEGEDEEEPYEVAPAPLFALLHLLALVSFPEKLSSSGGSGVFHSDIA